MQQIKNQTTAKPVGRLLHLTETILAANGGYLADRLYSFAHSTNSGFEIKPVENEASNKLNLHKLRWLILGREHYFETSKEYPIANKRELQRVLRFENDQAPFAGIKLQQIERINEQSHRVTFWVVKAQSLADLPARPWLLFPESYLLAKALETNVDIAAIDRLGATLFISKTAQVLSSGVQSAHTPSLQHFAFTTGAPINASNSEHYPTGNIGFTQLLNKGLKAFSVTQFADFFVKTEQQSWQHYPWKKAGIISGIFFALYIALSSGWLVYQQQQLQQQLTLNVAEVNQALDIQKQYKQQQKWQTKLVEPLKDLQPYWNIWPIVLETINTGAKLSAVHYKGGLITLQGETDKDTKATDILAKLAINTKVLSAKFSSPVTAYRGRERFAISFAFAKQQKTQQSELQDKQQEKPKIIEGALDAGAK